jgi:hypothetical protein
MSTCQNTAHLPAPPDDPAQRLAAYDELAASAHDFLARFRAKVNEYRLPVENGEDPEDADVDPDKYRAYDEMRADYGELAMGLVQALASRAPEEEERT